MNFKTVRQLAHRGVQRCSFAYRAEVIAIRFMLRETNHLAIGKFAQECDVAFANGRSQIAAPRQVFRRGQQISRGLIRFEPFA